jgi:pseudomonalisin
VSVRTIKSLAVVAALGAAVALPLSAGTAAGAATGSGWRLTQNLLPGLAKSADHGKVAASTPMTLTITVARPHPAAETAFINAVHDPSSASYRKFLTPSQFATRFGVSSARRAAVKHFLTNGNVHISKISTAGDVYSVKGTAGAVGKLFHTSIHRYKYDGTTFLANTRAPVFPNGLGITNIEGLNTLQRYSIPSKARRSQGSCLPGGISCVDQCVPQIGCTGGTTPQDLWSVYQQPGKFKGQGQQLAVFGEGRTKGVIKDLRQFEKKYQLPTIPVAVKHPAADKKFTDDSGHIEWNIDTQASSGMAPKASKLTLFFGSDLSDADVARVFSKFADDASGPKQASASYGECETIPQVSALAGQVFNNPNLAQLPAGVGLGNNSDKTLNQITKQNAAEGKTVFVSTGDTGSSCPIVYAAVVGAGNGVVNQVVPVTNSPASLPYVTAVGGTVLYTDGKAKNDKRTHEYGWAYSGGGSTLFTAEPSYQKGVANVNVPCVTDPTVTCRGIADVAAQSGDVAGNGYNIVNDGTFLESGGGGTSLSAPLMQGMWTRVQSGAGSKGDGFANYALYRAGQKDEAKSFFDIDSTDLSTGAPASNGAYVTEPGWDYVTGWGTPRVSGLICYLDSKGC